MWPLLSKLVTRFNVYICIPFGILGYYVEGLVSNRYTPPIAPVTEQREERLLKDMDSTAGKKGHRPLEVNLPPSLSA